MEPELTTGKAKQYLPKERQMSSAISGAGFIRLWVFIFSFFGLILDCTVANGATYVWDGGGTNNNWSVIENWNPDGAPASASDTTIQLNGSLRTSPSQNIANPFQLNRLEFLNTGTEAFVLGGSQLQFVANGATQPRIYSSRLVTSTISANIDIPIDTTLYFEMGTWHLNLNGVISGSGGIDKLQNAGGISLYNGANSFSGGLTIRAIDDDWYMVNVYVSGAMGTGPVNLYGGTMATNKPSPGGLTFYNTTSHNNPINLFQTSPVFAGSPAGTATVTLNGNIDLNTFTLTLRGGGNGMINGVISEGAANAIRKFDTGAWTLSGVNTYTGSTIISNGTLTISGGGSIALSTSIVVEANTIIVIASTSGDSIGDAARVTLKSGTPSGKISISNNVIETVGSLYFDGIAQAAGTYGSSSSSAVYKDDTHFTGTGMLTVGSYGDDGSWANNTSDGAWSTASNWTNNFVPFGSGKTAYFTNAITGARVVSIDTSSLFIGNLAFGSPDAYNWTLKDNSILLVSTGMQPIVSVSANAATISSVINGYQGFVKKGSGTLTLSGANTYSGSTIISNGTLVVATNSALGTGTIILSGGTLVPDATARILANAVQAAAGTTSELRDNGDLTLNGPISGSGTLTINSLVSNSIWPAGDVAAFTGTLDFFVNSGGVNLRAKGNATNFSNATFLFSGATSGRGLIWNGTAGSTIQIGALSGTGGNIGAGEGVAFTLQVGALNTDTTFAGPITKPSSGVISLAKVGTGVLKLSGANTYSGSTIVSNGTLAIVGAGSIASSTNIIVASGAQLTLENTGNVLSNSADVYLKSSGVTYGKIYLTNGVNERIGHLFLNGVAQAGGTWGATDSGCRYTNDNFFAGEGVLSNSWGTSLLENVPEASNYTLVYELDIPANSQWGAVSIPYLVNNATNITKNSFSRIAYYMELVSGSSTQWVYVSMCPFIDDATKIGVPNAASGEFYNYALTGPITNATVMSNVGGITTGTGINTINLEFWPSNYGPANDYGVPGGANAGTYDFGDGGAATSSGHGSMQIHNYGAGQTLFGYNDWNNNTAVDLGIGNQGSGNPDWTFADNASSYSVKKLQVLALCDDRHSWWTADSDGNWNDIANWNNSIAGGNTSYAYFTNAITASRVVNQDYAGLNVAKLWFGSTGSYNWTVSGGNAINLTNALMSTPSITVSTNVFKGRCR